MSITQLHLSGNNVLTNQKLNIKLNLKDEGWRQQEQLNKIRGYQFNSISLKHLVLGSYPTVYDINNKVQNS